MAKIPRIDSSSVNRDKLAQVVGKLAGGNKTLRTDQVTPAQALAITSSSQFGWSQFADVLGDKFKEVKDACGSAVTTARLAFEKLLKGDLKDLFTGDVREVAIPSDKNEAELNLDLPKVTLKAGEVYNKDGVKVEASGRNGQNLKVTVDKAQIGTDKEKEVKIKVSRDGKEEELTLRVKLNSADAPQTPPGLSLDLKPVANGQDVLVQAPEGYTFVKEKVEGKKFAEDKLESTKLSDDGKTLSLKASADIAENTQVQLPVIKNGKEEVLTVNFKNQEQPAPGDGTQQSAWKKWAGWVVPGVLGILVWLGTLVAGDSEKRGVGILGGIATFVAGLAIGGKFPVIHNLVGGDQSASQ